MAGVVAAVGDAVDDKLKRLMTGWPDAIAKRSRCKHQRRHQQNDEEASGQSADTAHLHSDEFDISLAQASTASCRLLGVTSSPNGMAYGCSTKLPQERFGSATPGPLSCEHRPPRHRCLDSLGVRAGINAGWANLADLRWAGWT